MEDDSLDANSDVGGTAITPTFGNGTSGNNSGFNWSGLTNSFVNTGGSVLTQVLKNQAAGSQTAAAKNLAAAQAASSSSTLKIVIIAVAGLAVVGVIFAFLRSGRSR